MPGPLRKQPAGERSDVMVKKNHTIKIFLPSPPDSQTSQNVGVYSVDKLYSVYKLLCELNPVTALDFWCPGKPMKIPVLLQYDPSKWII